MKEWKFSYVELVLLLVAFIWGINPPIMKIGLQYLPPLAYNVLRMVIAVAVAWLLLLRSRTYRPVAPEDLKVLFKISACGFFVFQLFFTVGVQKTTAGNASLFLGLLPVSVAIINKLFKLEDINFRAALGIIASLSGIMLIIIGTGKELSIESSHLTGAVMLLAAQAGYGYYTVFSKGVLQKYSTYQVTSYVVAITTAMFFLVSLPEMIDVRWTDIPFAGWASVFYSGVFALCIGNFLWFWGVSRLGSTRTSIYNNLSPAFAVVAGYLFLGETFGLLQFIGAAVIFAGLYLTRTAHMSQFEPAPKKGAEMGRANMEAILPVQDINNGVEKRGQSGSN